MSEQLKTQKRIWAEKKRHGSDKEKRAAISVQIGRVADKVLARNGGETVEFKDDNYMRTVRGKLSSTEITKKSIIPGRKKTARKTVIETTQIGNLPGSPTFEYQETEIDPTGKNGPVVQSGGLFSESKYRWAPYRKDTVDYNPTPEKLVENTAPVLARMRTEIKDAQSQEHKKAA